MLISTSFRILSSFIPKQVYEYTFTPNGEKYYAATKELLQEKHYYGYIGWLAHKLNQRGICAASKGKTIIADQSFDIVAKIQQIFEEKPKAVVHKEKYFACTENIETATIQQNDYSAHAEAMERYLLRKLTKMLQKVGYIPTTWFTGRATAIWAPVNSPVQKLLAVEKKLKEEKFTVTRGLKMQVKYSQSENEYYLKCDVQAELTSDYTLWDILKRKMETEDFALEEVYEDEDMQKELQKILYRSDLYKQTYDTFTDDGKTTSTMYANKIVWEKVSDYIPKDKTETVYDFHVAQKRELDPQQPVVICKYRKGKANYAFPVEFVKPTPSFALLKKIDMAGPILDELKPSEPLRLLYLQILLQPLSAYIDYPKQVQDTYIANLQLIHMNAGKEQIIDLYGKSMVQECLSYGQFRRVGVVDIAEQLTPRQQQKYNQFTTKLYENITKLLKKTETNYPIQYYKYENNLTDIFQQAQNDSVDILLIPVYERINIKWKDIKQLSIKFTILTQAFEFEKIFKVDPKSTKYYTKNLAFQMVYKCGGIPYRINNPNTEPGFYYLGIDRIPSKNKQVGIDAGACLMLPDGTYIEGMAVAFDADPTDAIHLDKLLSQGFLQKLHDLHNAGELQHLIILRDGGYSEKTSWIQDELNFFKKFSKQAQIPFTYVTINKSENMRFYDFTSATHTNLSTIWDELDLATILLNWQEKRIGTLKRKFMAKLKSLQLADVDNLLVVKSPTMISNYLSPNSFYLVTTKPTAGTKSSIRYNIIYSSSDEDILDHLAADLATLCKGVQESLAPTSIPAPVHYADKLAKWILDTESQIPDAFRDKVFFA